MLDRIFVSLDWEDCFPNETISTLSFFGSDHCPLLLQLINNIAQPPPVFRFDPEWVLNAEFVTLVHKWWDEKPILPTGDFVFQWKHLKRKNL